MIRFLFFTDSHFREDKPATRIDDTNQSQYAKLGEIIELVHNNEVDAVLHGGDFFNTKKPTHQLVVEIINWCKRLQVPVFAAMGNHDVTGYNLDSVRNSGLGVLFESGAIDVLNTEVYKKDKVVVKAVHTSLKFDQDYMFGPEYDDYTRIIISHNYIIPSETMPWSFIHPKDIKTNAHLVLCGHYHVPFDYSTETTRWINPGPLCRWSISEKDHKPRVLMIEINDGKLSLQEVYLKSAKPGDEIFDVEKVSLDKQHKKDIESFAKGLEETTFQNIDIEQAVKESAKIQNVSDEIVSEILKRIRTAKDVLR